MKKGEVIFNNEKKYKELKEENKITSLVWFFCFNRRRKKIRKKYKTKENNKFQEKQREKERERETVCII